MKKMITAILFLMIFNCSTVLTTEKTPLEFGMDGKIWNFLSNEDKVLLLHTYFKGFRTGFFLLGTYMLSREEISSNTFDNAEKSYQQFIPNAAIKDYVSHIDEFYQDSDNLNKDIFDAIWYVINEKRSAGHKTKK